MVEIDIPGFKPLHLQHLVLDYNGTLAVDGSLLEGAEERLQALSGQLQIHVLTADTFGTVADALSGIPCRLMVIPPGKQAEAKQNYLHELGPEQCAAVGNGRNDRLMLEDAALGVGVILGEGAASGTLFSGDVVCLSVLDALDLLLHPTRLIATLRS